MRVTKPQSAVYRMKSARRAYSLAGVIMLTLIIMLASNRSLATVQNLRVSMQGEQLSVYATAVPVRDILKAISNQTDMRIVSNLPLDDTLSIEMTDLSLAKMLIRILRDKNYILHQNEASHTSRYTLWIIAAGTERGDLEQNATLIIDPAAQNHLGLDAPNPNLRLDAVMDLADEDSSAALAQAISDPEPEIREAAIFALAEVGDETSVHLIRQALSDPDKDVRQAASEMLMELEDNVTN